MNAAMLVLANTLLLSFTLVLSLDVPAEVKEGDEDMVDFGGSVLRKSGLVIDYMVGGSGYTWKARSCKHRNKENLPRLTPPALSQSAAILSQSLI